MDRCGAQRKAHRGDGTIKKPGSLGGAGFLVLEGSYSFLSPSLLLPSLSPQLSSLSPQESPLPQLPQLAKEVEVDATEAMENTRPIRIKRMNLFTGRA